ncbi:MAG: hypothetical protein GY788_17400, partial [bacterium]|nr:hypothetical protein [bacterium]
MACCRGDRGIAIVAVLWTLLALSLLVGSLSKMTRSEALIGRNVVSSLSARYLADAGVHAAIMELLREPDQGQRPRDGGAFGIRIAGEIVT